jgi:alpha-amylase/alpha-mannosidase (GH57 family)
MYVKIEYYFLWGGGAMRNHAIWLDMGILSAHQSVHRADKNVMQINKELVHRTYASICGPWLIREESH